MKTGYIEALRRGKKCEIKALLLFPILILIIATLGISILSNGNKVFYILLIIIFIICYLMIFKALQYISNMMLLIFLLFLSSSILLLSSCVYLILTYVPLNVFLPTRLNIPYPWNLVIAIVLILNYIIYFIRKFSKIDIFYLKDFLKKAKKYNFVEKTYSMDNAIGKIDGVYKKKIKNNGQQKKSSFLGKMRDDFLSWLLLIAYYFIPVSPYVLRGVGHGEPLSYILLMGGLFFAWGFGMLAQRYYALFRVYHQIEKELGEPLQPILE